MLSKPSGMKLRPFLPPPSGEFFYDPATRELYVWPNATIGAPRTTNDERRTRTRTRRSHAHNFLLFRTRRRTLNYGQPALSDAANKVNAQ